MKTALVTGSDHGLGYALCEELLKRGYFVCAARLNPEETAIDALLAENPENMLIVNCDIGSTESVYGMRDTLSLLIPNIDLLINCAGILGDMEKVMGDDIDYDEILKVMNVNSVGPLRVSNALYDLLLKGTDKTIINISSEAGSIGSCWREGWFGYCMSKAGNNMQSALVHNNLIKQGGKVIAMHPGHVATYMRGHLDTTASLTPSESAESILHTVLDTDIPVGDHPVYIDFQGRPLEW